MRNALPQPGEQRRYRDFRWLKLSASSAHNECGLTSRSKASDGIIDALMADLKARSAAGSPLSRSPVVHLP